MPVMDASSFVQELVADNDSILRRLAPAESLKHESGGDLNTRGLLRIALKNELEATEIAALWVNSSRTAQLKIALARQSGDEAKHYRLIGQRLNDLGDDLAGFNPLAAGYSPLYQFLATLATDVERVAAGQFTREAIARTTDPQSLALSANPGAVAPARP